MAQSKDMNNKETINGLTERHVAQIVRRMMIQKVKPSKKTYNRKDKSWKKGC